MALKIKKKTQKQAVDTPVGGIDPEKVALAKTAKSASKGQVVATPTECKGCGHTYNSPCHGKDDTCPNWAWLQSQKAAKAAP